VPPAWSPRARRAFSRRGAKPQRGGGSPCTNRVIPSLIRSVPKSTSSPSRLPASRTHVRTCFLWTGSMFSADFGSAMTRSSRPGHQSCVPFAAPAPGRRHRSGVHLWGGRAP
jgi:hypothetical protein